MAPNDTDNLLARMLGANLQVATLRLVGGALAGALLIGLILAIL